MLVSEFQVPLQIMKIIVCYCQDLMGSTKCIAKFAKELQNSQIDTVQS